MTQIIEDHSMPRLNLTGKLWFVCKHCLLLFHSVRTLSEPCWGCATMENLGWES